MKAESKEKGNLRFYPCPKCGNSHPSITTILGVINSPALNGWLAKNGIAKLNVYDSVIKEWSYNKPEIHKSLRLLAEQRWKMTEDTGFWKTGREIGQEAADIGTQVHAWVEAHLSGVEVDLEALPQLARNAVGGYLAWEREHKIEMLKTEQTFYSCRLNMAGTADCVANLDGELTLLDWKTSNSVYANYAIQLWGYVLCDEEQNADRLYRQVAIGRFGKSGDSEVRVFKRNEFPTIDMARDILTACGHIFNFQQMWEEKFPYRKKESKNERN